MSLFTSGVPERGCDSNSPDPVKLVGRQCAGADGLLQRTFVDPADFPHKAALFLVQVVSGENSGGDRSSAGSKLPEGSDELRVFFEEDATRDVQGPCIYLGC